MEDYTFDAQIVERWGGNQPQVQIVPDDQEAYLDWRSRVGLMGNPEWDGPQIKVTVSVADFVSRCEDAERVRYTVRRVGQQMRGVDLQVSE